MKNDTAILAGLISDFVEAWGLEYESDDEDGMSGSDVVEYVCGWLGRVKALLPDLWRAGMRERDALDGIGF